MLDTLIKDLFLEVCSHLPTEDLRSLRLVNKRSYDIISTKITYEFFLKECFKLSGVVIRCPLFDGFFEILENYINNSPYLLYTLGPGEFPFSDEYHNLRIENDLPNPDIIKRRRGGQALKIIIFVTHANSGDAIYSTILSALEGNDQFIIFTDTVCFNQFDITDDIIFPIMTLPFLMSSHSMTKFRFSIYAASTKRTIQTYAKKLFMKYDARCMMCLNSGTMTHTAGNDESNNIIVCVLQKPVSEIYIALKKFKYITNKPTILNVYVISKDELAFDCRLCAYFLTKGKKDYDECEKFHRLGQHIEKRHSTDISSYLKNETAKFAKCGESYTFHYDITMDIISVSFTPFSCLVSLSYAIPKNFSNVKH